MAATGSKSPLLPHSRSKSIKDSYKSSPGRSPKCIREQYLRKLGYTPLVFQVEREKKLLMENEAHDREKKHQHPDEACTQKLPESFSFIPPPGSIRGSVFNLAGATLGAGALSLPYAVAVSGLVFAILQLIVATLLTVYTIRLLMRAGHITG